jgi:CRISPR-associated protein Cas2
MAGKSATRMQVMLIYDIPDDRARTKVADFCQDYGLDRIQYSAFEGELSRTHQEELFLRIKRQLGRKPAKVHLVAVAADDWARRLLIEQGDVESAGNAPRGEATCTIH